MFGKVASDMLGLSDIGKILKPEEFNKADADDYVMHEEGEKIYFLIKSKTDEYCFTNLALIHLDGTSATSKKRFLYRYNYSRYRFSGVFLETAGTMDLDIEIKFNLGEKAFSLDIDKNQIELLKDLYKTLLKIADLQYEDHQYYQFTQRSLEGAQTALSRVNRGEFDMAAQLKTINEYTFGWLQENYQRYHRKDYGDVFQKFIQF